MNAIVQNKHIFKDKVVLDVGCGTAILSMCVFACPPIALFAACCAAIALRTTWKGKEKNILIMEL